MIQAFRMAKFLTSFNFLKYALWINCYFPILIYFYVILFVNVLCTYRKNMYCFLSFVHSYPDQSLHCRAKKYKCLFYWPAVVPTFPLTWIEISSSDSVLFFDLCNTCIIYYQNAHMTCGLRVRPQKYFCPAHITTYYQIHSASH